MSKLSGPDVADEALISFLYFPFLCLSTSTVTALERIILVSNIWRVPSASFDNNQPQHCASCGAVAHHSRL